MQSPDKHRQAIAELVAAAEARRTYCASLTSASIDADRKMEVVAKVCVGCWGVWGGVLGGEEGGGGASPAPIGGSVLRPHDARKGPGGHGPQGDAAHAARGQVGKRGERWTRGVGRSVQEGQ